MRNKTIAILALLLLAGAGLDARSKKRHRNNSGNEPGVFDLYLLSLSWAPDFCDSHPNKSGSNECAAGNHVAFIVHGLWPQFSDGKWPKECAPSQRVPSDIVSRMLPLMSDGSLVQHEWDEHGTCSGLSQAAYFNTIVRANGVVAIPQEYRGLSRALTVNPSDVDAKFAAANSGFPPNSIHTGCAGGEVTEVHVCLSRDLKPIACEAERDCSSGNLKMLPVR